jgi:hypothetical protein
MADLKLGPKTLAGVLGSIAAAIALFTSIPAEESGRTVAVTIAPTGEATIRHVSGPQYLRAYLDAVKVPTACDGITRGVRMGQTYTEAQCTALLEAELVEMARRVVACVPARRAGFTLGCSASRSCRKPAPNGCRKPIRRRLVGMPSGCRWICPTPRSTRR